MEQNDAVKKHKCVFCDFASKRKYDLQRHQNAKHIQMVTPAAEDMAGVASEEYVIQNEENVNPNENFVNRQLICKKCKKIYKTKKYLLAHEVKCNGIDELTCPRCMVSFTTRQAKSKHILNKKCKPRSILYARKPNTENITNINTQNNIATQNNNNINTQNNIATQHNNNIIINNYGSERTDYLDYDKMLEIFKTVYNIPSLLTKHIHFNKEFPENNNILQDKNDKTNALVKIDDEFIFRNIDTLISELLKEKTRMMYHFANNNKDAICVNMETYIYDAINEILIKFIQTQKPADHYKIQEGIIRDMINNSRNAV
uniref:C2H2-type domain-containing protein n=1 Tax=viral metagenome TaxID=1070528 RepID=A0A6C0CE56_9ZZZZ